MRATRPEQPIIKIDYTLIPPADLKSLFRALTNDMIRFYDDPKNREGFEAWMKSRKEKEGDSSAKDSMLGDCASDGDSYTDSHLSLCQSTTE